MLRVLNAPYGDERYQRFVPQSIRPVGYCPLSGRSGLDRLSNVMIWVLPGVGVTVGLGTVVGVLVAVRVTGVLITVGVTGVLVAVGPPGVAVNVGVDVFVGVRVGVAVAAPVVVKMTSTQ